MWAKDQTHSWEPLGAGGLPWTAGIHAQPTSSAVGALGAAAGLAEAGAGPPASEGTGSLLGLPEAPFPAGGTFAVLSLAPPDPFFINLCIWMREIAQ